MNGDLVTSAAAMLVGRRSLFLTVILTYSLHLVLGTERCGYSEARVANQTEVERDGNCIPFYTGSTPHGTPCDVLYKEDITYVYISNHRRGGNFQEYLRFFLDATLTFNLIQPKCINEARKILCHYFLPTCGNETVFVPPTSVCQGVCEYLRSLCPKEFAALADYFSSRPDLGHSGITLLNCSNTGEYIAPLNHCCSDLDIAIPCTKVNSSGDLVPDPECMRSDSVTLPSPSPSAEPQSTEPPTSSGRDGNVIAGITIAILVVTITFTVVVTITVTIVWSKKRKRKEKHAEKNPTSYYDSSRSADSMRYQGGHDHLLPRRPDPTQRVVRVPSSYIRQMADEKLLIPGRSLNLLDTIGQGEFGVVYRGNLTGWRAQREHSLVAVKTLKGVFGGADVSNMIEESVKMAKFSHPNVMRLIGVCIDKGTSPYIVMPYMAYGSLLSYLKKQRVELTLANDDDQELVTATQSKLLSMCLQVAKGMSYLADQQFVHRDLAARNCMIDENFILKVADFGLSEDIYARNYFRQGIQNSEGEGCVKLPVRWMAVESLHDGIFSEKTDVWSFGVTLWEIFSLGKIPYPGVDPFSLIQFLDDGGRLGKPANAACSDDMYSCISHVPACTIATQ
jgi:c-mer proto-oncogene tyrosine kinase/anaplastic lymphoma kinase/receptor tyrosine kinase